LPEDRLEEPPFKEIENRNSVPLTERAVRACYALTDRFPWAVLCVFLGLCILSFGAFSEIRTEDEIESTITDRRALEVHEEFRRHFDEERRIAIAWDIPALDRQALIHLRRVVDAVKAVPEAGRVFSVLDLLGPQRDSERFAESLTDGRIARLAEFLRDDRTAKGQLISDDMHALAVVVIPDTDRHDWQNRLCESLDRTLSGLFEGREFHVFGYPWFKQRFMAAVERNNRIFLAASFLVCAVLAWFLIPDPGILLMIVLAVLLPAVYTFAIYFMNGNRVNLFTAPIVPFALVISLNEIIFIVSHFTGAGRKADIPDDQAGEAEYLRLHERNFRYLIRPCFINMLTTLIGFFVLSANPSRNIQLFSVYTSLACFFSYLVIFGFVFAFLRIHRPPATTSGGPRSPRFFQLQRGVKRLVFGYPRAILLAGALASFLGGFAALQMPARNGLDDIFSPADPLIRSFRFMAERFGAPYSMTLMVRGRDLLTPEGIRQTERLQKKVSGVAGVTRVFSAADLVHAFNERFTGSPGIPDTPDAIRAILSFFANRGMAGFYAAPDGRRLAIEIGIASSDDREILRIGDAVKAAAEGALPEGVEAELTGEIYLGAMMQGLILDNVARSFAAALVMIVAVFWVAFGRFRQALFALLVNFLPILAAYGTASLAGMPFNPSTAVVGCVMSGLVVDDTLHILTHFGDSRGKSLVRRVLGVLDAMFHPVLFSALLLGLANAVFLASDFQPFREFGGIGALIVVFGILGDLVFLPALFLVFGENRSEPVRATATAEDAGVE